MGKAMVLTSAPVSICRPVQGVPAASSGFEGVPFVQRFAVHAFESTGRSASSTTSVEPPEPSQRIVWQSPVVCLGAGPASSFMNPHACDTQVRWRQGASAPGQSVGRSQPPQITPRHVAVPPAQGVLAGTGGFDGIPLRQTSSVHSLPSTGRSVSSATGGASPPIPSHRIVLQSPGTCRETDFVAGAFTTVHV
jgi:hypothetical protein